MSNSYISVARVRVIFVFIALTLFSQPSFVEPKTESLLIFGDSISAGYGMSKDKQWSEELKKILDKEGIKLEVLNRSISGETTGGGLSRIKKLLDILRPDYLLIELGGNDALRGYPPKKIHENLKVTNNLETTISSYKPTIFWKEKEIVKQQINKLDIETLNSLITKTNDIELLVKKRPLLSTYVVSNFIIEQTN